jgi:hypothetical protein
MFNLTGIDFVQARSRVFALDYKDYDDFVKKYGSFIETETPTLMAIATINNYFEAIGYLLKRNLVEIGYVWDCYGALAISLWEKIKPIVKGVREQYNIPNAWAPFEYLCNEMKKREQQLAKTQ